MSRSERLAALAEAAAIWNATQKKPLLAYAEGAALRVDFSYDERQALDAEAAQVRSQLAERESLLKPSLERLKADSEAFNARQEALGRRVEAWNAGPRNSAQELSELKSEEQALKAEYERLKAQESYAKSDVEAVKLHSERFNETVRSFNKLITDKPEQGLYEGPKDRITIYFSGSRKELVHTLAHELGHALGLGHTAGPSGIMHPDTNESLELSAEDLSALAALCSSRRPR